MNRLASALILVILGFAINFVQAQSAYGPVIGVSFNSLADRKYIDDNSISSPEPEIHIGGAVTSELSPYISLLGTIDYSFQNFSVYSGERKREMRLQYLNINPGVQITSFDEAHGVIHPYFNLLTGLSLMTNKRIVDGSSADTYPDPTSFRIRMSLGAGLFFKFSEFSRLNIGADYGRTFTEAFKDSDARMNSIGVRAGVLLLH